MATIILPANGQSLNDIPDYIASDDQLLRDMLVPMLPDLANATFERKEVNGVLTVTVSKRAGTKGTEVKHTPGPWERSEGPMVKGERMGRPEKWRYVQHNFPDYPYEGELCDEYGIYPPLGEAGPVALVAGKTNAQLIAAAPEFLALCKHLLELDDAARRESSVFLSDELDEKAEALMEAIKSLVAKVEGTR